MAQLGARAKFFHYAADHAFFNDTRAEVYDAAASADAWQKILAFYAKNLG